MKLAEQVLAMYTSVFSQHVIKKKKTGGFAFTIVEHYLKQWSCHATAILSSSLTIQSVYVS